MKRLAILGSTGSIGTQTLDVVDRDPDNFQVVGLAARRSWELLAEQAERYRPALVAVLEAQVAPPLRSRLEPLGIPVLEGVEGVCQVARMEACNLVVSALVGMAGLRPTLAALQADKPVALANKEALVVGGDLVMSECHRRGLPLYPIDSEHSAIFQCLHREPITAVQKIILTASGGPFRQIPTEELPGMTAARALKHPTWDMGAKITIDSATLMNKGFEVLEAHHLFGLSLDQVEVWVHPQSIVHSCVEFVDGSVLAQMGPPDMRTPIQYALNYPDRKPPCYAPLRLSDCRQLTFEEPRWQDFPCLTLAFEAGRTGGSAPAVLNAANEVAVELFLHDRIGFTDIPRTISETLSAHTVIATPDLEQLLEVDRWARHHAEGVALQRAQV